MVAGVPNLEGVGVGGGGVGGRGVGGGGVGGGGVGGGGVGGGVGLDVEFLTKTTGFALAF